MRSIGIVNTLPAWFNVMLIPGQSGASVLMPIDTATLLNSQVKSVEATGASKEFLRKGFENAEPNICAVLTGALKV